jgi:hypothetical protein
VCVVGVVGLQVDLTHFVVVVAVMDYSSDPCKDPARGDGFSAGQILRMRAFWDMYREADVTVPATSPTVMTGPQNPSSETVDVYIEFQYDRFASETSWEIISSDGDVLVSYPSGTEQGLLSGTLPFPPGTYTLIILDSAGDGTCCTYGRGYALVSVDGAAPVGGYGLFSSTATVTFTVASTAGASSSGGGTDKDPVSMTVPQGSGNTMIADGPKDPKNPFAVSSVRERWTAWNTLAPAALALFAYCSFTAY